MPVPVTNFGKVQVSTTYDSAATTIVLSAGHGSRLPSTFPFPLIYWNATDYPDPSDDPEVEIVSVTARVADTLTVSRAQEGTTATNKNTAGKTYKMLLGLTKAMYDALFTRSLSQSHRGLRLSTHPSSTLAASAVFFSADTIVMDDGEEVPSWSNLSAAITASGANGLDTGSETGSTWYEVYAIRKSSDGTKAALLHQAKDYGGGTSYQSGQDGYHNLRDATARTKLAQGFTLSGVSGLCEYADVWLIRTGAPVGNYWLTIEANVAGVPSGVPLATSDKYDAARVNTVAQYVRLPFRTPASLSASTQYHLVLQGDYTVSGANYLSWGADTTAGAYSGGSKAAFDGATWTTDTDDDFEFNLAITRNDVAVTLPSGYDQKAKLGYVYNNSSSNFKHFWQVGRRVFAGYDADWATNIGNTTPSVLPLAAMLPPTPVLASFTAVNSSVASAYQAGHISATDTYTSTFLTSHAGTALAVVSAAGYSENLGPVMAEYQAIVVVAGAGSGSLVVKDYEF